jgi:hypothetical protein
MENQPRVHGQRLPAALRRRAVPSLIKSNVEVRVVPKIVALYCN